MQCIITGVIGITCNKLRVCGLELLGGRDRCPVLHVSAPHVSGHSRRTNLTRADAFPRKTEGSKSNLNKEHQVIAVCVCTAFNFGWIRYTTAVCLHLHPLSSQNQAGEKGEWPRGASRIHTPTAVRHREISPFIASTAVAADQKQEPCFCTKTPSSFVSWCGSALPFADRTSQVSSLLMGFAEMMSCPLL